MTRDGVSPSADILDVVLGRFTAALLHRGRDGIGRHVRDDVALMHTRLAVVDVAHGAQPFVALDGIALIANGEIYNDPALRLVLNDARFATGSDCESALHLYRRDGERFAEGLRGMYALAIHDPGRRRLVLARDPFGIKPLYYAETPRGFYFASEPQALIAAGVVAPSLNKAARDEMFAFQFTTGTETLFDGINRVAPGQTLIIENGCVVARLHRPALPAVEGNLPRDDEPVLQSFDEIWRDTVLAHQRADVPYGMFLSSGIDSAAVLAMMAQLNDRPVLAFTAAFPDTAAHDERAGARAAAAAAGARHVEIEITAQDFWRTLPAIAAAMDDPAADYAVVPSYLLARAAARDVKVVLSGEGGDELFAGYGRTRAALRPWPFSKKPWRRHKFRGVAGVRALPTGWRDGMVRVEAGAAARFGHGLRALQAVDCAAWLPNDLLLKVDRCLMAHGVEGRVPFLDPAVAGFAFPLADRQKIRNGRGKWLLRQWLAENFPAAAAFAPKRGFTVPVVEWISTEGKRLGPLVARQPGVAELGADLFEPGSVEALFANVDRRNGAAAWALLFYALWHRRHIIGASLDGDVFAALAG